MWIVAGLLLLIKTASSIRNISVVIDGQPQDKYVRFDENTNKYSITMQNIYIEHSMIINEKPEVEPKPKLKRAVFIGPQLHSERLLQEEEVPDDPEPADNYSVEFINVLIQMSAFQDAKVEINLANFDLNFEKSTLRGKRISVIGKSITFSLSFIVYHQLYVNTAGNLLMDRSETYHVKEFCSNNTTGFALKAYFDANSDENCTSFQPYDTLSPKIGNVSDFFTDDHNVRSGD